MNRDLDEGPDEATLARYAKEARERHELLLLQERAARLLRRQAEPVSDRMRKLEVRFALTSHTGAANLGREGSGGSKESGPPPWASALAVGSADPREVGRLLGLLEDLVGRAEVAVGLGPATNPPPGAT